MELWIRFYQEMKSYGLIGLFFWEISSESVDMTVKELELNLKEIMSNASESAKKKLSDAKVVGIACDVCKPEDVEKLSNFAVKELGSINIWVKKNIFHCNILCLKSICLLTVYIQLDR